MSLASQNTCREIIDSTIFPLTAPQALVHEKLAPPIPQAHLPYAALTAFLARPHI